MKSVVVCGSSSFAEGIRAFAKKLKELGVIVYEPHLYRSHSEANLEKVSDFNKQFIALGLTHDHFYKMRLADIVYIYNQDGYIGNSVNIELGYALALNKPVYAYDENDPEIYRKVLFSKVIKTPEELIKYLQ